MTDSKSQARDIAAWVAERLADPAQVRQTVVASIGEHAWWPTSLGEGYAGISLLFSSLPDPDSRRLAHAHLVAAVRERQDAGRGGLFCGDFALAFAAAAAARFVDDYRSLRDSANRSVARALSWHKQRKHFHYETISGLTGLGRYLLAVQQHDPLRHVLSSLVNLAHPISAHGHTVPGWWVNHPPALVDLEEHYPRGHFNLGLAHGISGPLALLSLATSHGVIVRGQREAIETITAWLLDQLQHDDHGPFWPHYLTFEEQTTGKRRNGPARAAWCYGTPGVARAIQLAGLALAEPTWTQEAINVMRSLMGRPGEEWRIHDGSLCHGASGLLHVTATIAESSGDAYLLGCLDHLVGQVIKLFDPNTPFGFRYTDAHRRPVENRAGMLEGAAGIALALTHIATPAPNHAVPWDSALLLK